MTLRLIGNRYRYELENILQLFYPAEQITELPPDDETAADVTAAVEPAAGGFQLSVSVLLTGKSASVPGTCGDGCSEKAPEAAGKPAAQPAPIPHETKAAARTEAAACQTGGEDPSPADSDVNADAAASDPAGGACIERRMVTPDEADCERLLARLLFEILREQTGLRPAWGIQTGVRPVKLYRSRLQRCGRAGADTFFREDMLVSEEKLALTRRIAAVQDAMLNTLEPRSYSLYISIPFCPSRCSYCSFISHDVTAVKKLLPEYIDCLCRELHQTALLARELGLRLQTVYIGGGTPTAVSAGQLQRIMETVHDAFDTSGLLEFTVEAGRPDTVTEEKLRVIAESGGSRISINPQTLNDEVLQTIRRRHTVADFYRAYALAQAAGITNINTDLIAGLPGDTPASFDQTLQGILELAPACVTVHTLSIKRSSRLVYKGEAEYSAAGGPAAQMVASAGCLLPAAGYRPYYLYRQSRQAGNLENTGWSKPGQEGYYNVFIMEEQQTILAVGAGASTKLVAGDNRIERIFNYKYPYEYIRGFDEMLARKRRIAEFYKDAGMA